MCDVRCFARMEAETTYWAKPSRERMRTVPYHGTHVRRGTPRPVGWQHRPHGPLAYRTRIT